MIHKLLDFIFPWIWFIVGIAAIYYFIRTVQRHGILVAFKGIFSYRLLFPILLTIILSLIRASLIFIYPHVLKILLNSERLFF